MITARDLNQSIPYEGVLGPLVRLGLLLECCALDTSSGCGLLRCVRDTELDIIQKY